MPFRPLPTHLLDGESNRDGMHTARATCGAWNPRRTTTDPQAVTCAQCQDRMDLQPS